MAGGGPSGDGEPEFQVAPMIDVLLVLLVFFMMITSAQVLKVDKSIELPVSKNAVKKDTKQSEVIINVRWDSTIQKPIYVVDDHVYYEAKEIVPVLKQHKIESDKNPLKIDAPPFRAVIRGDLNCPDIHIAHAMNSCADAGIADVSFSAVNKR